MSELNKEEQRTLDSLLRQCKLFKIDKYDINEEKRLFTIQYWEDMQQLYPWFTTMLTSREEGPVLEDTRYYFKQGNWTVEADRNNKKPYKPITQ